MCLPLDAFEFIPFVVPQSWREKTELYMPVANDRWVKIGEHWDSDHGYVHEDYFYYNTPCCLWTGWSNGEGHGKVRVKGRAMYVHRRAFELAHAVELAKYDIVDHLCRNRACWNPEHLEKVTMGENTARGLGSLYQFKQAREYRYARASG